MSQKHAKKIGFTQKQLSETMDVSLSAVQNYESGKIPNGEILIRLSRALACSTDWLLMGTGGQSTDQVVRLQVAPEPTPAQTSIYNDMGQEEFNMGEILAQTIDILNSKTVYTTAIVSNIKAFHKAITTEKKIDDMQAQLNQALSSFQGQLDKIQAENAQLRQELEQSRAESAVRNTG